MAMKVPVFGAKAHPRLNAIEKMLPMCKTCAPSIKAKKACDLRQCTYPSPAIHFRQGCENQRLKIAIFMKSMTQLKRGKDDAQRWQKTTRKY